VTRVNLRNLDEAELVAFFADLGEPRFRADQVFRWLFGRGVRSFAPMTDLGRALRERLAAVATLDGLEISAVERAEDGTTKLALDAPDGARIESVLIPDEFSDRLTLCLSTQVGCRMGCAFCRTAELGLRRNLRAGEIVDQYLRAREVAGADRRISNLVLMGMGEPLANLRQVIRALRILLDDRGPNLGSRRITVSTSGLAPALPLLGAAVPVRLAVSLNATTDAVRDRLMPVNRRYPLATLLQACRDFPLARRDRITFEYVLLAGVNDSLEDAERLVALLRGLPSKVNLIAFNEFPGCRFRRPAEDRVLAFQERLIGRQLSTFVRASRGQEISAACGLLAGRQTEPAP